MANTVGAEKGMYGLTAASSSDFKPQKQVKTSRGRVGTFERRLSFLSTIYEVDDDSEASGTASKKRTDSEASGAASKKRTDAEASGASDVSLKKNGSSQRNPAGFMTPAPHGEGASETSKEKSTSDAQSEVSLHIAKFKASGVPKADADSLEASDPEDPDPRAIVSDGDVPKDQRIEEKVNKICLDEPARQTRCEHRVRRRRRMYSVSASNKLIAITASKTLEEM